MMPKTETHKSSLPKTTDTTSCRRLSHPKVTTTTFEPVFQAKNFQDGPKTIPMFCVFFLSNV